MLIRMQRFLLWWLVLGVALGLPLFASGIDWNSALAQRSGGGVGGRGGFRTSPTPSVPRVNPSPAPTFPTPSYPNYPTYPSYPYGRPPVYVTPGVGSGIDLIGMVMIVGLVVVGFAIVRGLQRAGSEGGAYGGAEAEVARLRLATLYTPELQRALRALAENSDTQSTKGLADLVDNAAVLLLRDQAGWRFGAYENWKGSLQAAEGQFDQWMTETRSEFVETYRKFEGQVTQDANYVPRAEPDGRYLLVTFVVAANGMLPPVPKPLRAAGARQALMALSSTTPVTLLAAYLSWTPEAGGEALTEQDLLSGWPGLELL